ncbi:MAG: DNA polymerase III subunit beta [Patescibacteria group bacterium]|nr:DNA polymerase III subunit beta [Patescibacteria group bacterium]
MKVSCNQTSLAQQLSIIGRLVSNKPGLPILANVLLETEDSKLKMTATDLELGVRTWIGAEVGEDGKITIPARTFSEFVNSLPPEKVDIELKKQLLKVKTVNNEAQFNTLAPDDFPSVPSAEEGKLLMKVVPEDMKKAVDRVAFAAATDDSRPVLTGIKIEADGTDLTLIAVDGFRLSRQFVKLTRAAKKKIDLLVPAKAMQELARVITDLSPEASVDEKSKTKSKSKSTDKDSVEVYLMESNNQIIFRYKEVDLISRLIDGQFPEYKQIIPTGFQTQVDMDTSQIQNAVRIVNIFARSVVGNKAIMEFSPEKKHVKVSAALVEVGENESSFDAKVEGDELKVGFSAKFLSDMLASIDGDTLTFEGSSPTAPGVFRSKGDDTYLHIIMPMRID